MVCPPSLTDKLQPHITKHQGAFQKGTGALEQAWLATQLLQERREQGTKTHAALTDLEKCGSAGLNKHFVWLLGGLS